MYHRGKPVDGLPISIALDQFIEFLSDSNNNLLLGHNCKSYDRPILLNALSACGKLSVFSENISGFLDTYKLFRLLHPCLPSYTQKNLVSIFLGEKYSANDARDDVVALKSLYMHVCDNIPEQIKTESTFTLSHAIQSHQYSERVAQNLPSLQHLVDNQIISIRIAKKIAGSGLNYWDLESAHKRGGRDGIHGLFSERYENLIVRVTNSQKVIDCVSQYLNSVDNDMTSKIYITVVCL